MKLFWQHVVAQHLIKTLYVGFSFNLSLVCTSGGHPEFIEPELYTIILMSIPAVTVGLNVLERDAAL